MFAETKTICEIADELRSAATPVFHTRRPTWENARCIDTRMMANAPGDQDGAS